MSERPASSHVCRACGAPLRYYGRRDLLGVIANGYNILRAALSRPALDRQLVSEALDELIEPHWSEQERCTGCFPPREAQVDPEKLLAFVEEALNKERGVILMIAELRDLGAELVVPKHAPRSDELASEMLTMLRETCVSFSPEIAPKLLVFRAALRELMTSRKPCSKKSKSSS